MEREGLLNCLLKTCYTAQERSQGIRTMYRPLLMIACLLTLTLSACAGASVERNVERMNGFVGQSEEAVIKSWGVPDKAYMLDSGVKIISYADLTDRFDSPTSTLCIGSFPGDFGYSTCTGGPSRRVRLSCERSFHLKGGTVIDWSQHGNNCPGGDKH